MYVDHYGNPIIATKPPTIEHSQPETTPTKQITYSQSETTPSKRVAYSSSVSMTLVLRKSISYSISCYPSQSFTVVFDEKENAYIPVKVESYYVSYLPYIIQYYSPSYIPVLIPKNS